MGGGGGVGLYSQLLEIGEVLEHIGRKLGDVIHAQVTVEGKHRLGGRRWRRRKTKKKEKKAADGIDISFRLLIA